METASEGGIEGEFKLFLKEVEMLDRNKWKSLEFSPPSVQEMNFAWIAYPNIHTYTHTHKCCGKDGMEDIFWQLAECRKLF